MVCVCACEQYHNINFLILFTLIAAQILNAMRYGKESLAKRFGSFSFPLDSFAEAEPDQVCGGKPKRAPEDAGGGSGHFDFEAYAITAASRDSSSLLVDAAKRIILSPKLVTELSRALEIKLAPGTTIPAFRTLTGLADALAKKKQGAAGYDVYVALDSLIRRQFTIHIEAHGAELRLQLSLVWRVQARSAAKNKNKHGKAFAGIAVEPSSERTR